MLTIKVERYLFHLYYFLLNATLSGLIIGTVDHELLAGQQLLSLSSDVQPMGTVLVLIFRCYFVPFPFVLMISNNVFKRQTQAKNIFSAVSVQTQPDTHFMRRASCLLSKNVPVSPLWQPCFFTETTSMTVTCSWHRGPSQCSQH